VSSEAVEIMPGSRFRHFDAGSLLGIFFERYKMQKENYYNGKQ
jgi:hypothetical protein